MRLQIAREELNIALLDNYVLSKQGVDLSTRILSWWDAYVEKESRDTFLNAFRESRLFMTMRPPGSLAYTEIEAKQTIKGSKVSYPNTSYAVGVDTLAQRMNPQNFEGPTVQGIKNKYKLGLMDLSGTLLNPKFETILTQLRWKPTGKCIDWLVVFIPLPEQKDVEMYYKLKNYASLMRDQRLSATVVQIRHRMTRPKMAANQDMGSGLYDLNANPDSPKLRYGPKAVENGKLSTQSRKWIGNARKDYKGILEGAKLNYNKTSVTSNEVTIALRQIEGDRFPIITKWSDERKGFVVENEAAKWFAEKLLCDRWSETKENSETVVRV